MKMAKETTPARGGARAAKPARIARKPLQGRAPGVNHREVDRSLERQADEAADMAVRGERNVSRGLTKAVPARYDAPSSSGEPLEQGVREDMEATFGADLKEVRIHKDGAARSAARKEQAKAFTAGRDIYFGEGEFDPAGIEGRRLLAHEVAHVLQQTGRRLSPALIVATPREGSGDIQMRPDDGPPVFHAAVHRHGLDLECSRGGAPPVDADDEDARTKERRHG
ncbi:eCIS core domain-containing protein [Sorangium sp. So ce1097]|uniref:eCIS core domain-containing protein n=1 Tax=Sorangium sp. So ce1097 TaxID=3133330 RepID=UPI003F5E3855